MNPDMPWNEEIRASWGRHERLAASPRDFSLITPALVGGDVRAVLPTIRVPTLVVHHSESEIFSTKQVKYVTEHIPGAKLVELTSRNFLHFVEPWRVIVPGDRAVSHWRAAPRWPMTECSQRCSLPTSSTRHGALRRWATVTGMPCLMHMTRSCVHNSTASEAVR